MSVSHSCCVVDDVFLLKKFQAVVVFFLAQLLTAASIIKSSAVQNLHTDGPFDAVTTPDCVFEMERFAATWTTYTLTSEDRVSEI